MSLINMLPDEYLARQKQRRTTLVCIGLFVVVVIGVITSGFFSRQSHHRTQEVSQNVNQSYSDAGKLIQQLQELEATRAQMLDKAKMTAALLERVPRSYLLAMVTEAMPEGCSIAKLELASKKKQTVVITRDTKAELTAKSGQPSGPIPSNDVMITLTGLAGTDVEVARFIAGIARNGLVEGVELVYSEQKKFQEQTVREFQVVITLKNNADVRNVNKTDAGPEAVAVAPSDK